MEANNMATPTRLYEHPKEGRQEMNITVNIDNTQMSKIINDGINALDDETVTNIARQSLCEAFKNTELARDILFERKNYYYELREWAQTAIAKALTTSDYEKFKALVFEAIDKNAKDIIIETLAKTLTNNLFTYEQQRTFSATLIDAIKERRD